jgi:hypothetical protein
MQTADARTLKNCPCDDANPFYQLEDYKPTYRARIREEGRVGTLGPSPLDDHAASAAVEI